MYFAYQRHQRPSQHIKKEQFTSLFRTKDLGKMIRENQTDSGLKRTMEPLDLTL
jgi:hypothetical protein